MTLRAHASTSGGDPATPIPPDVSGRLEGHYSKNRTMSCAVPGGRLRSVIMYLEELQIRVQTGFRLGFFSCFRKPSCLKLQAPYALKRSSPPYEP